MAASNGVERIRFGPFELSGSTGELLKEGVLLKLQPQPFHVLRLLVARPGELVTREEIQEALWPNGTTVEFSQGLNFCIRQIRAALNDDAREPRFIETLPKRGYRFIAPVEVFPPNEATLADGTLADAEPARKSLKWWLAGTVAAAVILFVAILPTQFRTAPEAILVRPFVSLNLPQEDAWFADVLTQQLVASLADTKSLRVIPWSSSMALKGQSLGVRELGARFHVDSILEGSLRRSGDRLRLTTQLVDVASERILWSNQDERDARDLGKVQDDLLIAITGTLKLRITEGTTPPARRRPQDLETYNLYLRALYLADEFSTDGVAQSIDDFEEVIRRAPGYAPAYAGLANALTIFPFVQASAPSKDVLARARSAAQQAIALDPGLAAAHTALAHSLYNSWDWKPAEKEFRTALSLDPDSAVTLQLHAMSLVAQGRAEEGVREANLSVALAPTSGLIAFSFSQVLVQTGHFDEAIAQSKRTLEIFPHFPLAYISLARAYAMKGMIPEALGTLQEWAKYDPRSDTLRPLWTARTLALAGQKEEAERLIRAWRDHTALRKSLHMAYVVALLACGDTDEALAALLQSVEQHAPSMIWLKSTPELVPIRSDRRFAQALAQMNLD
ncbi:MAG TPA: tetratricopeptide repeat protein [Bryobacteraceae bacterium]|nr:tetratricopeptide repeat protein [Bryobacteraceae bacterium]